MQISDSAERLARMLARLNSKSVRFDVGAGGGGPSLTAQDIAAALGMVPSGLGRALLEHVYWPDGARLRRRSLLDMLTQAQLTQHNAREEAVGRALCQVAICTPSTKREAARAYSHAHLARWPQWVVKLDPVTVAPAYEHIRLGVLEELSYPRICPACGGHEMVDRKGQAKKCERCQNLGVVRYGQTWRAARLGMKRAAFIERWEDPYEWLLDLARKQVADAENALTRRLV